MRQHVAVEPDGWIVDEWPMTKPIATIVQPWVEETIDVASGNWTVAPPGLEVTPS